MKKKVEIISDDELTGRLIMNIENSSAGRLAYLANLILEIECEVIENNRFLLYEED